MFLFKKNVPASVRAVTKFKSVQKYVFSLTTNAKIPKKTVLHNVYYELVFANTHRKNYICIKQSVICIF